VVFNPDLLATPSMPLTQGVARAGSWKTPSAAVHQQAPSAWPFAEREVWRLTLTLSPQRRRRQGCNLVPAQDLLGGLRESMTRPRPHVRGEKSWLPRRYS